jgi:hypothetical protein
MRDDATDRRKPRAGLYLLLCLVVVVGGGIGTAVIKHRWGEGLGSRTASLGGLLVVLIGMRPLCVNPSRSSDGRQSPSKLDLVALLLTKKPIIGWSIIGTALSFGILSYVTLDGMTFRSLGGPTLLLVFLGAVVAAMLHPLFFRLGRELIESAA